MNKIPLCVDLDGTLIKSDIFAETFLLFIKHNPLNFFITLTWLLKGKANAKSQLAKHVDIDIELLPYNHELITYLKEEHDQGRKLVLATATNQKIADQIAKHVGIFSEVLGSDEKRNLIGSNKADLLVEKFGSKGFDYAGDAKIDLKVWKDANSAIVINKSNLYDKAQKEVDITKIFEVKTGQFAAFLKCVRVRQWIKNSLLFIPLLTAHKFGELYQVLMIIVAFLSFSLTASATYIINDLLDISVDRKHKVKKNRPFAAGDFSIFKGLLIFPLLYIVASLLALTVSKEFAAYMLIYAIGANIYSFYLKRILMVDVIVLTGFYTFRIIAGGKAANVEVSAWLLGFSMFIFLSLALVKRFVELQSRKEAGAIPGRGYQKVDLRMLSTFGTTSGYCSAIVLALYMHSSDVMRLYTRPEVLWLTVPLMLYWISRIWLIAGRGLLPGDPIIFATKDPISYVTGFLMLIFMLIAL